jgi:spermidine dehydrogenase
MSGTNENPDGLTRRDFLNGTALAIGASLCPMHDAFAQGAGPDASPLDPLLAEGLTQDNPRYYPPALAGMRGSHPGSFESAHHVRDTRHWVPSGPLADTGEVYDLVVVGGGISGLSAAHFFRKGNPDARILVLDNHDDFGGHAKRNEFQSGGRLLLGYGGTQSIEAPGRYSAVAKGLLEEIGIEVRRFYKYYDQSFYDSHKLTPSVFFDRETFGRDQLLVGRPGDIPLANMEPFLDPDLVARMPIADAARADLIRLHRETVDYMPGLPAQERRVKLIKTSYKDFLLDHARVHPDVVKLFQKMPHDLYCVGIDAVSASTCRQEGFPGFRGMPGVSRRRSGPAARQEEEPYIFHFPDGNASVARLLVRALLPDAMPGRTMEDVVTAKADYTRLDRADRNVRIRLNSTVVSAKHLGDPGSARLVEVIYVLGGKAHTVRAAACVMACYNCMVPYLCPEMPETQKAALAYAVKEPLVYTNVQLRNWTAFQKLGTNAIYAPGSYFSDITLDFPVSLGDYEFPAAPQEPCVIHMLRTPCEPGLTAKEQYRAGRWELYSTPFATFEQNVRDQLGRMLAGGGFDPRSDIEAITVNRWPHGYAYEYNPLFEPLDRPEAERPCVVGRQPFGRIAIANSDSDGRAYTNVAIDQGWRAVNEIASVLAAAR